MAGLLAAHVLAPHYSSVTVVERDRLPKTPQFRKGVPQSRHTHLLLGRGLESLETLLPGIVGELLTRGAVPLDWPGDALWLTPAGWCSRFRPGMSIVSASRDLLEWSVRERVLPHPGIAVLEAAEVTALIPSADGNGVAGVHIRDRDGQVERVLRADLVLDASGRGSKADQWLSDLNWQPAQELSAPTNVGYASRWYQQPDDAHAPDWRLILLQTQPPEHTRSGMLLPVDGGRWMVSLVGVGGDHPPTSEEGFLEFARSLRSPVLYEAIREAKPLSPIHAFRVPDSRRRRYERERRWPEGFAVIGDALCSLNPMYAQGVSVAAVTALALGEEISRHSSESLGRRIQRHAARSGADAWLIASGEDLRYLPPDQQGRRPLSSGVMQAYFDRVLRAARTDATVNAALLGVLNLQRGPYSMLRPAVVRRSLLTRQAPAETRQPSAGPSPAAGPARIRREDGNPMSHALTFPTDSPLTGEPLEEYPVDGADEIGAALARARSAGIWWDGLGSRARRQRLLAWTGLLARQLDDLAELVRQETGKPLDDARLEVALALGHLSWAARRAGRVLKRRRVRSGLVTVDQAASIEYRPLGVVGVIGPWNHPVFTPLGAIGAALAAGNAVILKPSQYTPGVANWLLDAFRSIVPEQEVLQVVTGGAETGAALCRSGVDKISFTGSTATAKKAMSECSKTLTPIVAECGGKDAMIVAADADLKAAAQAAVWGSMNHAGQNCVGIERVYAVDAVYDALLAEIVALTASVRAGGEPDSDYGPIVVPEQIEVISRHIADALDRGGRAVVGGPESVRPPYVDPVVLVDVPEASSAVTEETFGPVLVVNRVRDINEAVRRTEACGYGLGASVFSRNRRAGAAIARRLTVGAASLNAVVTFAAVPELPFGGTGISGFGRVHGADGLREFSRPQALAGQRFPAPLRLLTFTRTKTDMTRALKLIRVLYGRR